MTITNSGSPAGPSPSRTAALPKTPTPVDGSITVSDTNGKTFSFSAGATVNYNQSFPCATADGPHTIVHENTATIHSTGQSASAQATIHCAAPTTLTNTLTANTIYPSQSATDQATITGADPHAGGTITYNVYSDNSCHTLFADATPTTNTVTNATAPPSAPITFNTHGTYYWQATYSGDPTTNTLGATSTCTPLTVKGWQTGDLTSYNQIDWGENPTAQSILSNNFIQVYTTGSVKVGGTFTMRFTTPQAVLDYLPAAGTPAQLTANLVDPTSSPAGSFGGDVLALQIDVDFADAGLLPAASGLKFGDLTICNLTTIQGDDVSAANGMTVRELLADANTVLGGGTANLSADGLGLVARAVAGAFSSGTPSSFAQTNLVNGSCS